MIVSIYLHKEIANTLKTFGTLEEVVNRILIAGAEGNYDITNKPNCVAREGARRYEINITEPEYLELLKTFPINSSRISLRRLLYWFVENEMYNDLNWAPVNNYIDEGRININRIIKSAETDLIRLNKRLQYELKNECQEIINSLKSLEDKINDLQYSDNIIF
jgi:hypothetical protein